MTDLGYERPAATFREFATLRECFKANSRGRIFYEIPATPKRRHDRFYCSRHKLETASNALAGAHVTPTPEMLRVIEDRCIYDVKPENVFFELLTTSTGECHLHWKYQSIIGGRFLARIQELER